jgi:hypothetical protein
MKLKYKCTDVHRGAGWQLAVLVTHNDGTVEPWHRDTQSAKLFVPIASAAYTDSIKEGVVYTVTLEEDVSHEESTPGVSVSAGADSPQATPTDEERGSDPGVGNAASVASGEEGKSVPPQSEGLEVGVAAAGSLLGVRARRR